MRDRQKPDRAIDRLVRRVLMFHEERVDVDAFLNALQSRREARRSRIRVLRRRALLAAAAVLLVTAGALLAVYRAAPVGQPDGELKAEMRCLKEAARAEAGEALAGVHSAGTAAISAGSEPLLKLADARPSVPDITWRPELWLDEALQGAGRVLDKVHRPFVPTQKEAEP